MKINPTHLNRLAEEPVQPGMSGQVDTLHKVGGSLGTGATFEVQDPTLVEAFHRLAGTLMQAPPSLLQAGNETALADFLKQARFEPSQFLQDLQAVSNTLSRLPAGQEVMVAGGPRHDLVWSPGHGFRARGGVEHGVADAGGAGRQWFSSLANVGTQATWNYRLGQRADGQASLTPDGLKAQGDAWVGAQAGGGLQGHVQSVLGDASIQGQGTAGVQAWGQGQMEVGLQGLKAQGQVGAEGRVGASLDATFQNALLRSDTHVNAGGVVGVQAQGNVQADATGVQGHMVAGAKAEVAAELRNQTRSLGVNVGGERLDVNSEVKAVAHAGARANAEVDVAATILPPRAGVEAEAGAFAGAKAGVEGKFGLGDFVAFKGRAEAWAGAGAQAGLIAGLKDGKLRFGFHAGAAVEVGGGFSWSVEIDVQKITKAMIGGSLELAERGLEFAINPLGASARTIQDIANLLQGRQPGTLSLGKHDSVLPLSALVNPLLEQRKIQQQAADTITRAVNQWLGPDPKMVE